MLTRCQRLNTIRWFSATADQLTMEGWVRKTHRVGKLTFVHVDDGTGVGSVQAVVPKDVGSKFKVGSALRLCGQWKSSQGRGQEKEFYATQVQMMAEEQRMAMQMDLATIRNYPDIRPTLPQFAAILRARSHLMHATHNFFKESGFDLVDCPLLSLNESEGSGEVFEVTTEEDREFFGAQKVFLPVSGQLHLEAITCGLPKVYALNPAFRAEKCLSSKHLAEFRMLEAEVAFLDDLDSLCDLVESYVKAIVVGMNKVGRVFAEDTGDSNKLLSIDVSRPFHRVSYEEALDLLSREGTPVHGRFSKQNELDLVKHLGAPVFVQRYPAEQKPFYMRMDEHNKAECFDLLAPVVGELAGGSVREYDVERLRERCTEPGLEWYVGLRSYHYPRSSGFGLGIERLVQSLFGIENIKDTVPFPRWYKHIKC